MIEIAAIATGITLLLGAISYGIGVATNNKKIKEFGTQELFISIINSMLVGLFAGANIFDSSSCEDLKTIECKMEIINENLIILKQEIIKMSTNIGYFQTIILDFSELKIEPFKGLEGALNTLNMEYYILEIIHILTNIIIKIIDLFYLTIDILFAIALLLRAFEITRNIGNRIIVGVLLFYILLPIIFTIIPDQEAEIKEVIEEIKEFNNEEAFNQIPITNINNNNAVAEIIDNMKEKSYLERIDNIIEEVGILLASLIVYIATPLLAIGSIIMVNFVYYRVGWKI